jgi:endoglycosylceramidase
LVATLAFSGAARGAAKLPLGHAGRWITDASGRVVVVHGINMVYKLPPYYPAAVGFGGDDAAFLSRIGFNAVRVGVIWKAVEPRPGVYDDSYLNQIQRTVATLARHGIFSLLDFHQDMYNERFQGEGFPDWSVQDNGLPATPKGGFPTNYFAMPAVGRSFDNFWANSPGPGGVGLQDRYAAAWRHVAARFRGYSSVLGYELMNEPWPGSTFGPCLAASGCPAFDAKLTSFNGRVLGAIRHADWRTLVWYEPNVLFNFGGGTTLGQLGDPRAGFAFHDYCLAGATGGGTSSSCSQAEELPFINAQRRSSQTGDAVLETEFGATNNVAELTAMVQRADRSRIGWLEWAYCGCSDPTTQGPGNTQAIVIDPAEPPRGANLELSTVRALVEPYPQAVSGTPGSYGFDPATRTFSLAYTTARASGRGAFRAGSVTEVATPPLVYPRGYATRVGGGAVVSAPGAAVLDIVACPGRKRVDVTVTPSGKSSSSCRAAPLTLQRRSAP